VRKSPDADELPAGAVTPEDLVSWELEFHCLVERMGPLFGRPEPRAHAEHYLRGLLAPLERKNGWTIAEYCGQPEPKATQRFLNLTPWDADKLRDLNLAYARENFADSRGTLIADPTGFAKKGRKSAGVQRQYAGTLGRIDNYQIGTFLAYADRAGNRVLVDRELYIPRESWFGDPQRCREAGIPEEVTFATRPQQVRAMIERVVAAGLPFAWFTADEEFGQNPGLREFLEDSEIPYVMAVPKSTVVTCPDGKEKVIAEILPGLRDNDWQRRACGIGTKGLPGTDTANTPEHDKDTEITQPASDLRPRPLIQLSIGEIRRLFNLPRHDLRALYQGLRASVWRRRHQADPRRRHFRRRLRLQTLTI